MKWLGFRPTRAWKDFDNPWDGRSGIAFDNVAMDLNVFEVLVNWQGES